MNSTIEYVLEHLESVAKQIHGMPIPERTWNYILSRMDTLDMLQSLTQDSMAQHAAWLHLHVTLGQYPPLDGIGWQMLIQDIYSETGIHPSKLSGLDISVNTDRMNPKVSVRGTADTASGEGLSAEGVLVIMQMANEGLIEMDEAIKLAETSDVPIYNHEKQIEFMAQQMGIDPSELDGMEPPHSGEDVFIL